MSVFQDDVNGTAAKTALPVWDAGSSLPYRCHQQREGTLDLGNLSSAPPLPSVTQAENLISNALNRYKYRKFSADMTTALVQKQPEMMRRKSADSGIQSEYVDIDLYQDSNSRNCNTLKSCPYKDKNDNLTLERNDLRSLPANSNDHHHIRDGPVELMCMLDLLNSYQRSADHNTVGYKSVNQCHDTVDGCLNLDIQKYDDFPIYATVDKTTKSKKFNFVGNKKVLKPIPVAPPKLPPPTIPPKPKCFSDGFDKRGQNVLAESEHSPEMQVMINSLSPVLIRRNSKSRRKNTGSSTETSPDSTPEVLPRVKQNQSGNKGQSHNHTADKSLFMDPKMAKTWHGATSTNWSNVYGPQMRAMMKELNKLTSAGASAMDEQTDTLDDYEARCRTLPSKSLLDQMHKKFCADQYSEDKDVESARAKILFRLKHQPLIKPKRSQSFNIRMGTSSSYSRKAAPGYSGSSGSSESSPMFPRASERVRIKTRPDVQYSPKLSRTREVTPEPLMIEEVSDQVSVAEFFPFVSHQALYYSKNINSKKNSCLKNKT